MGATCVENWDIAYVTVQNDKVPVELDLNLLFKDKQRVLDPVVVAPRNEISGRDFCKGRRIVTSPPRNPNFVIILYLSCIECMYIIPTPMEPCSIGY